MQCCGSVCSVHRLHVQVPDSLWHSVVQVCAGPGVSVSVFVRRALEQALVGSDALAVSVLPGPAPRSSSGRGEASSGESPSSSSTSAAVPPRVQGSVPSFRGRVRDPSLVPGVVRGVPKDPGAFKPRPKG